MLDVNKLCFSCMASLPEPEAVCPACGYDNHNKTNKPYQLLYSKVGGRYLIGRAMGQGGFGITYVGFDLSLSRKVAVKEFYPRETVTRRMGNSMQVQAQSEEDEAAFAHGRARFLEEAQLLANLADVENVAHVTDFFKANGTAYIVMDYVQGQTLKTVLSEGGPFSSQKTVQLMLPIIHALEKIHGAGIIHRDISPDNIILRERDGQAVLIDFGAARKYSADESKDYSVYLKQGFAPLEQYSSNAVQSAPTDVYALCATMYYMLTGEVPAQALDRSLGEDAFVLPSTRNSHIPSSLEAVLVKGMALAASDRYESMEQLAKALEAAVDAKAGSQGAEKVVDMIRKTDQAIATLSQKLQAAVTSAGAKAGKSYRQSSEWMRNTLNATAGDAQPVKDDDTQMENALQVEEAQDMDTQPDTTLPDGVSLQKGMVSGPFTSNTAKAPKSGIHEKTDTEQEADDFETLAEDAVEQLVAQKKQKAPPAEAQNPPQPKEAPLSSAGGGGKGQPQTSRAEAFTPYKSYRWGVIVLMAATQLFLLTSDWYDQYATVITLAGLFSAAVAARLLAWRRGAKSPQADGQTMGVASRLGLGLLWLVVAFVLFMLLSLLLHNFLNSGAEWAYCIPTVIFCAGIYDTLVGWFGSRRAGRKVQVSSPGAKSAWRLDRIITAFYTVVAAVLWLATDIVHWAVFLGIGLLAGVLLGLLLLLAGSAGKDRHPKRCGVLYRVWLILLLLLLLGLLSIYSQNIGSYYRIPHTFYLKQQLVVVLTPVALTLLVDLLAAQFRRWSVLRQADPKEE